MTVKELIQQIEYTMGRQPEQYMVQLINDALMDMSGKVQHYTTEKIQNLNSKQRWYKLDDSVVDITKVEILSTPSDAFCSIGSYSNQADCEANGGTWTVPEGRYTRIPLLADSHRLLKDDTDETSDSLK
tara:strand:- start:715 stop:1101 length:387 start_codon:yes stop_codon:yes gene_type:complete